MQAGGQPLSRGGGGGVGCHCADMKLTQILTAKSIINLSKGKPHQKPFEIKKNVLLGAATPKKRVQGKV